MPRNVSCKPVGSVPTGLQSILKECSTLPFLSSLINEPSSPPSFTAQLELSLPLNVTHTQSLARAIVLTLSSFTGRLLSLNLSLSFPPDSRFGTLLVSGDPADTFAALGLLLTSTPHSLAYLPKSVTPLEHSVIQLGVLGTLNRHLSGCAGLPLAKNLFLIIPSYKPPFSILDTLSSPPYSALVITLATLLLIFCCCFWLSFFRRRFQRSNEARGNSATAPVATAPNSLESLRSWGLSAPLSALATLVSGGALAGAVDVKVADSSSTYKEKSWSDGCHNK